MFVAKYAPDGTLIWATTSPSSDPNDGRSIATDRSGNSYVTGFFEGVATFGAGEDNATVLSAARHDIFVAKYAPDGTLHWATSAGGSLQEQGHSIATDRRGNSYVTGFFNGTATFGAGEANETVLISALDSDVFVAKYAQDGTLLWATSAGGDELASGLGIATDSRGNSYLTGEFRRTATFGAGEANETVLETGGFADGGTIRGAVFVAKYAREGTLLWATSAGGANGFATGIAIATDPRGNSYVIGSFSGTARFGAGEANETVMETPLFSPDAFVAKYAREGTLLWATSAGGSLQEQGEGIATDRRGNSYVTGFFSGTATFGAGEAHETVLEPMGASDVFVAKYGDRKDQDQCPESDRIATVVLDDNDTGVRNVLTNTEGCTILDLILQALEDAADRTDFIRGVALLTRTLLRDGLITAEEAGILRTVASQATFPLS
jgi:hypothetical protein